VTAPDVLTSAAKELLADPDSREIVLPSGAIISATLATPLAVWLTAEARRISCASSTAGQEIVGRNALAVARAILGTQETA
jgi:hypothetical protein